MIALIIYAFMTVFLIVCGMVVYRSARHFSDAERRMGARSIFLAPLWPFSFVTITIRAICRLWRFADFKKGKL